MIANILVKKTGCRRTEIVNERDGVLHLNVKGRPEQGEANIEIIKFFRKKHGGNARIIRGLKGKRKVISVD